jgi:glycogen(starch) synthase
MKVLLWTPIFWPDVGGIELIYQRHVQSLKERGHDCMVLTSHGRVEAPAVSDLNGIPVHRFPIGAAFEKKDLRQIIAIQKEIQELKKTFLPDVEHLNFGGPTPIGFFTLKTAAVAPAPMIVALHGSILGLEGGKESITGEVLRAAAWTTTCSAAMLEDARLTVPEITKRSSVVYYGGAEVELPPTRLPFDEVRILCLGRLVAEKGFDLAIEAFAQVVGEHPHARLVIAGEGPARPALEEQVANLKLERVVDFTGEIKLQEVHALINQATMMVVPSRWREAFGLVALEAAQMARPVVACRVGGLPEAVLDGETGLLVDPEDSRAIARAITWLLENPDTAMEMGQNGHRRACDEFSWENYIDRYEDLYRKSRRG